MGSQFLPTNLDRTQPGQLNPATDPSSFGLSPGGFLNTEVDEPGMFDPSLAEPAPTAEPTFALRPVPEQPASERIQEIKLRRQLSADWQANNLWPKYERTVKAFMQVADPIMADIGDGDGAHTILNQYGEPYFNDGVNATGRLSGNRRAITTVNALYGRPICPPDLYTVASRRSARMSANVPSIGHRSDNVDRAMRVSSHLSFQWANGGGKEWQALHVLQGDIFGISYREVSWTAKKTRRFRTVFPNQITPDVLAHIKRQYPDEMRMLFEQELQIAFATDLTPAATGMGEDVFNAPPAEVESTIVSDEELELRAAAKLATMLGGRIPLETTVQGYTGCEFMTRFVGDIYPEPTMRDMNKSAWFIDQILVNDKWLEDTWKVYGGRMSTFNAAGAKKKKQLADALNAAYKQPWTGGDAQGGANADYNRLRAQMLSILDYTTPERANMLQTDARKSDGRDARWIVTRVFYPGTEKGTEVEFLINDQHYLGRFVFEYLLDDGALPFAHLIFRDDLFHGFGDPMLSRLEPIQGHHAKTVNMRQALVDNVLRPLITTSDPDLASNPYAMLRGLGYRLIEARPNSTTMENQAPAIAAIHSSMANDSQYYMMIQGASGESNTTMMADVNPRQLETATGVRSMDQMRDVITQESIGSVEQAVTREVKIARDLCSTEMVSDVEFHPVGKKGNAKIRVMPSDYQDERGEIYLKQGSLLADGDDSKVQSSMTTLDIGMKTNGGINMDTAIEEVLVALGHGDDLERWRPKPMPPPLPAEPRVGYNASIALSIKDLPPELQPIVIQQIIPGFVPGGANPGPMGGVGDAGVDPEGPMGPGGPGGLGGDIPPNVLPSDQLPPPVESDPLDAIAQMDAPADPLADVI